MKASAEHCCWLVCPPPYYIHYYQCQRKRGHGPSGRFCKQHAKMLEKNPKLLTSAYDVIQEDRP